MKLIQPKKVLSVCGSGGRALPLIHEDLEEITCVDLSKEQLLLLELRSATIKTLSLEDFSMFWGYPPYFTQRYTEDRQKIFNQLKLSQECHEFFSILFVRLKWQGLIYQGKWENTFVTLSKVARKLLGKHCDRLFEFTDLKKQQDYLTTEFPQRRWRFLLKIVGNKALFNALLYKGSFVKKNIPESYFNFYYKTFSHLMNNDLTRNSFFLQLCFLGEIRYSEGVTIEAKPDCFQLMKSQLNKGLEVKALQTDLIQGIKQHKGLNFVSMSDVPSYFSGDVEKNFLQEIKPHLAPGAIVVIRSYLRVPEADRAGYTDVSQEYHELIKNEKVGVYRIEVLKYDA